MIIWMFFPHLDKYKCEILSMLYMLIIKKKKLSKYWLSWVFTQLLISCKGKYSMYNVAHL